MTSQGDPLTGRWHSGILVGMPVRPHDKLFNSFSYMLLIVRTYKSKEIKIMYYIRISINGVYFSSLPTTLGKAESFAYSLKDQFKSMGNVQVYTVKVSD